MYRHGMRLNPAEACLRFRESRVARLATVSSSGEPHMVPITFASDGSMLYFAVDHKPKASSNLRRLRNIRENNRVSILVDRYADDWSELWWVRADGHAEIWENDLHRACCVAAGKISTVSRARTRGPCGCSHDSSPDRLVLRRVTSLYVALAVPAVKTTPPAPAVVADHHPFSRRQLLNHGVTDPDAPDRMRPLCARCHNRETARLQPRRVGGRASLRARVRRELSAWPRG
ncbi:TIGR03668 family PPOX class F420-dependent oxidoreductase [Embleya sp. AB8]|uniref:TIGR03668 family PPOX class F420-dependent oxidoreductase n=1 Tax=Embleya sp. AB8 TaxID=3156304 RepID=UPI003C795053